MSTSDRRAELYEKLSMDLVEHGAAFIARSPLFQSVGNGDGDSRTTPAPILRPADPPVRAIVLHLGTEYADQISSVIREIFLPYFKGVIWFQKGSLYHSSMFHTSHQLVSVLASEAEIEAEARSIKSVACSLCPLKVALDRVVLTSSGVLMGCWQVLSGTDPLVIRTGLKEALPNAPEKQLYDPAIFHTSFARILGHPIIPFQGREKFTDLVKFSQRLVQRADNILRGFQVTISEMWFVEELDIFALALDGRMRIRKYHLGCPGD